MKRALKSPLFVVVLLVPGGVGAHALYHCQIDGEIRSECCCPEDAHHGAQIEDERCCDVQVVSGVAEPDRATAGRTVSVAPMPAAQALEAPSVATVGVALRGPTRVAPPGDPPLFIRFCSYLI